MTRDIALIAAIVVVVIAAKVGFGVFIMRRVKQDAARKRAARVAEDSVN